MGQEIYPSIHAPIPVPDLETFNTDRSVTPPVMVRGMMVKTSAGWSYWDGSLTLPTNLEGGGKVSVGTTQVEVTFTGTPTSIIIQADVNNTGLLFVGKTGVTNAGANALCFLEAGRSVTLDYDDITNAIYVISDTAGQYFWKGALL